jgi:hypothetical protein
MSHFRVLLLQELFDAEHFQRVRAFVQWGFRAFRVRDLLRVSSLLEKLSVSPFWIAAEAMVEAVNYQLHHIFPD